MATLDTTSALTLLEWTKRQGDTTIAEVLNEVQEWWKDAKWAEASDKIVDKYKRRASLPTGSYRDVNGYVASERSTVKVIMEELANIESYMKVDKMEAELNGNVAQFLDMEQKAFLEGLAQTVSDAFFRGNSATDPRAIDGLATRYNKKSTTYSPTKALEVATAGSGTNTSAYLVQWGDDKASCVFPKGRSGGIIETKDLGIQLDYDANGAMRQVFVKHFQIGMGLRIKDDRNVVRLCNIDTAGTILTVMAALGKAINFALRQMPMGGKGAVLYVNKTIASWMDYWADQKPSGASVINYTRDDVGGAQLMRWAGVPVRITESILDTEAALT